MKYGCLEATSRQVTRTKSKSGAVVKYQKMFMVLKTPSNVKQQIKSGAVPLYPSLVASLHKAIRLPLILYACTRQINDPPFTFYGYSATGDVISTMYFIPYMLVQLSVCAYNLSQ